MKPVTHSTSSTVGLNRTVVLEILRKELLLKEIDLCYHKLQIAHYWDLSDKNLTDTVNEINFNWLNHHKNEARKLRKKMKAIRESLKAVKGMK